MKKMNKNQLFKTNNIYERNKIKMKMFQFNRIKAVKMFKIKIKMI